MEQIPVTIRIPQEHLALVDLYAKDQDTSRSDLIRSFVSNMINDLKKQKLKDKLTLASKKVSRDNLIENVDLEASIEDGLSGGN